MRGVVGGLESPVPLVEQLPAVLQDDDFTRRFVSAFDVALAPILATLDALPAYIDPLLAPEDFLEYLAAWIGVDLAGFTRAVDLAQRRELVARAVATYRRDGTGAGIRDAVAIATGGDVEIVESGGARWSAGPGSRLPGDASFSVRVRVALDDPASVDVRRLTAFVALLVPAHVVHSVEVVKR